MALRDQGQSLGTEQQDRRVHRHSRPSKGNHGPVRVHNTYHFAYADGTPFKSDRHDDLQLG
jgi:hypothetical protein